MWSDNENGSGSEIDETTAVETVSDPEVWMDYYSEELMILWRVLKNQATALGCILDTCSIGDFTEFCFRHSSGRKPSF